MNNIPQSERLQRFYLNKDNYCHEDDLVFCRRIIKFLNHVSIDEECFVDAFYYDFSVLPRELSHKFGRDMYLIFGITQNAEFISAWVERWDLDSEDPIINGKVIRIT